MRKVAGNGLKAAVVIRHDIGDPDHGLLCHRLAKRSRFVEISQKPIGVRDQPLGGSASIRRPRQPGRIHSNGAIRAKARL